jgi:hypothetical protein
MVTIFQYSSYNNALNKAIAGLFFILCFFPLMATAIHMPIPMPLLQVNAQDLSLSSWQSSLNKTMGQELCQAGTYWDTCFDLKKAECTQLANSLVMGCTTKMRDALPPRLSPLVASLAGQQVGFCVGELFYKLAHHRLKSTPDCQQKRGT